MLKSDCQGELKREISVLIGVYAAAIVFFFALYQSSKSLNYIDQNKVFLELSVSTLKHIKYYSIKIGILYAALILFIFPIADADHAPGLVAFPIIIVFAASVVTVFADVLQKL